MPPSKKRDAAVSRYARAGGAAVRLSTLRPPLAPAVPRDHVGLASATHARPTAPCALLVALANADGRDIVKKSAARKNRCGTVSHVPLPSRPRPRA